jgi:nicotinate-nucleotide pyrophosphorylase (carboxylating)
VTHLLPPRPADVERIVAAALAEDMPWGDITSEAIVPASATMRAAITAREPGTFCGSQVIAAAMRLVDPRILVETVVDDGEAFASGAVLLTVAGPAGSILAAERVGLNLAQRLSGIATLTRRFAEAIAGTGARITDTRKTTPGLRVLERHAVRCGGGANHRFSLSDAVLVKDNHLALLGDGGALTDALAAAKRRLPHTVHFEVEVDRLDQIEPVLAAGVDTVLLDNFSISQLEAGVRLVAGRALVEASGNVQLDTVAGIAATGVDLISAGALTHSVRALDLGLDVIGAGLSDAGRRGPAL